MESSTLSRLPGKNGPFTLIGRHTGVDVYHRDHVPSVELAAVGDVDAAVEEVHAALMAHVDPRVIATIAESWIAGRPPATTVLRDGLRLPIANDHEFSLSARWTIGSTAGLSFKIADNRGANTRARNWVDRISGSWALDPIDDGRSTRAIYHVRIDFASPVARWTFRSGAVQDLPTVIQHLRSLVSARPARAAAASSR